MITHRLKDIQHTSERAITPFHIFDLSPDELRNYTEPHTKDHFCLMYIQKGQMTMHVEDRTYSLQDRSISIIFPGQLSSKELISADITGKIILFDEVLFCSDILKNELRIYNYNIATKLNHLTLEEALAQETELLFSRIETLYQDLTSIKKEQARFYIKILLLGLVDSAHTQPSTQVVVNEDGALYGQFLTLLERNFKTERTVAYYAKALDISPKKLNAITKKLAGFTAIETIHSRILNEIRQLLLLSRYSHKEIAFELGFNSPAALNKFVRSKLDETPTDLQKQLGLLYNR